MSVRNVEFSQSVLFFWIKGSMSVDERTIKASVTNPILGLIPAGQSNQTIPLSNVSAVSLHTSINLKAVIFGLFLIFVGCLGLEDGIRVLPSVLLVWALGTVIFLCGILTVMQIQRSGSDYFVSVPFYEKRKMLDIQEAINDALIYTEDKRDFTKNTDRIIEVIRQQNGTENI